MQVLPQLIWASVLVTVPVPLPFFCTVSENCPGGVGAKVAVTDLAELIVTWQLPEPEQAPLHPVKLDPAEGLAVRVTDVPLR